MNEQILLENQAAEAQAAIEADFVIATHGNRRWAVVSMSGAHREEQSPCVVYEGLATKEAAEFARREAVSQQADHGIPYGPSEVPLAYFEALGRVLKLLREQSIDGDLHALACKIAEAATGTIATSGYEHPDEVPI